MIYLVSFIVFAAVVVMVVVFVMLQASGVASQKSARIMINNDPERVIETRPGEKTLLAVLSDNGIFLPSACGGNGFCGQCRCRVESDAGEIQPTELNHLTREEQQDNIRLACQLKVRRDMNIHIPESVFSIKKYSGTVISNRNVATFIKELVVEPDNRETIRFEAGQYMQIDIPEYNACFTGFDVAGQYLASWERLNFMDLCVASDEQIIRAYSLANPPYERLPRFNVRLAAPPPGSQDIPSGVGSSYVFNLKPGDRMTFSGPYGDFLAWDTDREMCFVGGGSGMAPVRSHILHQLNTIKTRRKISFWYGARSWQEMFYFEEFRDLAERFDNFSFNVALSDPKPEDNWQGPTGFIHTCLYEEYLKHHDDLTGVEFYLCGPSPMIAAAEKMLEGLGVEPDMIAYDKF